MSSLSLGHGLYPNWYYNTKLKKGHLEVTAPLRLEGRKHVPRARAHALFLALALARDESSACAGTHPREERLVRQECAAPAEQVGQGRCRCGREPGRTPTHLARYRLTRMGLEWPSRD